MRWQFLAATFVAAAVLTPAHAQGTRERQFEHPAWDTNRSWREIYVPVLMSGGRSRPAEQPYTISSATWYVQPIGARDVKPDNVLDKSADYRLESFDTFHSGDRTMARVVILRRGASDGQTPQIDLVEARSKIEAFGMPTSEQRTSDGTRYTFEVMPPAFAVTSLSQARRGRDADKYEIRLLTGRTDIHVPRYITRAPTFGGLDPEGQDAQGPPQLPYAERVAGKRIEYRAGRVVDGKPKK